MKNLLLVVTLFLSIDSFAQQDLNLSICEISAKEIVTNKNTSNVIVISQQKLLNCLEIGINNKTWKISSFSLGMVAGKDYLEINTKGNRLNDKMVEAIKKYNPEKIYIEKIVASNNSDEAIRMGSLVVKIN